MAEFRFQAAGLGVRLAGTPPVIATLEAIYRLFPPCGQEGSHIDIEWDGQEAHWATSGNRSGTVQVLDPGFRPQITTILIARLLAESRPDLFLLHGNALQAADSQSPLFLLGDSGAGKTTLTRLLLESHPGWRILAEDTILVDGPRRLALPFPRAAALREAGDAPGIKWGPIGAPGPAKLLEAPATGRLVTTELPLAGTHIVLLERHETMLQPAAESGQPNDPELTWTTYADQALEAALCQSELPFAHLRLADGVACLRFHRPLKTAERLQLEVMLEHAGAVTLHVEPAREARIWRGERPASPRIEPLAASDGIHRTLKHIRRQTARQAADPPGKAFLRLAQALGECRFHLLVPGGTPEETRETLEQGLLA